MYFLEQEVKGVVCLTDTKSQMFNFCLNCTWLFLKGKIEELSGQIKLMIL